MSVTALSKGKKIVCQKLRLDKKNFLAFNAYRPPIHLILWNISYCFILQKLPMYLAFQ